MTEPEGPGSGRNIVAMCDGTGNGVEGDLSNVLKLFMAMVKDDRQRVFYDAGIGTIANDDPWGRLRQRAAAAWGLATGTGLDDNVLDAYRFLCLAYRPGDRIFLFGFSRGAYTARIVAALVHMVGLLPPDQTSLAEQALAACKRSSERDDFRIARQFSEVLGGRRTPIHFIGAWDTVASIIAPRPDRFNVPTLRTLPHTRTNPSVRTFRHAIAIDERRRMFRLNRWVQPQDFVPDPSGGDAGVQPQDIEQRWFPGVHADIGGGYPERESALSKAPLLWMAAEARRHGLLVDEGLLGRLGRGLPSENGEVPYVAPDSAGPLHRSLRGAWWLLEALPRSRRRREARPRGAGLYLPLGEPRTIPANAIIDPSAFERRDAMPGYHSGGLRVGQVAGDGPRT